MTINSSNGVTININSYEYIYIYILCSAHFKSKIKIENTIDRVLSFTIIQKPTKNTLITIEKGSSGGMAESKRPLMDL